MLEPWGYTPLKNFKRNKHWWRCPAYPSPEAAERCGHKGPMTPLYNWRALVSDAALDEAAANGIG